MVHEIRSNKHLREGFKNDEGKTLASEELAKLKESEIKVYTKKPEEADQNPKDKQIA